MNLALFDLDDTLLNGDITQLWSDWLINLGWIEDAHVYRASFAEHMRAYAAGELDMEEHLNLLLRPLEGRAVHDVSAQVDAFLSNEVIPRLFPGGLERLAWHRDQGHQILIISASTAHLVAPLAQRLDLDGALATALEVDHSANPPRYTGRATGIRTFREGKLMALESWLNGQTPHSTWGYSDSRNDIPLLEAVDHAYAIHPDPTLASIAQARRWEMPDWR
jgi:HAD superfamily hydrolase (TIGR01490 family)|uniref:HAD family hydrolase n=1 Tax=Halomonas sp. TaxID=1486246 RepID=UPI002625AD70|nr:HAD family hydrolase [Halomonas sp.]